MKQMLKMNRLPAAVAGLGAVGLILRKNLYIYGMDVFNLLVDGHPLEMGLWLVTLLTAALILAAVWKKKGEAAASYPASFAAALGHIWMAAGILLTVLGRMPNGLIGNLWKYLGIAAAPLLVWAGLSRAQGKQPNFLGYAAACLFFVFHLVSHYQSWCSNPQLQDFVFAFSGAVCLMLFAYYQAALAVGMGNTRLLWLAGLLSLYLCLVAASGGQYLYLYLGGAVWAGTGLVDLEAAPAKEEKAGDGDAAA